MIEFFKKIVKNRESAKSAKPKTLYKYIGQDKIRFYFPKLSLAFPHIDLLNDPFETNIQSTLDYTTNLKWTPPKYRNPIVKYKIGNIVDYGENPFYDKYEESNEYQEAKKRNYQLEELMNFLIKCRNEFGVLSLTSDPLNVLMWAHYGNNHQGICIGFDMEHSFFSQAGIGQTTNKCNNLFNLLKVEYNNERPNYNNYTDCEYAEKAFTSKFKHWSYEEEYRLIRKLPSNSKILIQNAPNDVIKEIYLGIKTDIDLNIFNNLSEKIDIYRVKYENDWYRLNKEKLNLS
jgi:hypothetical protein